MQCRTVEGTVGVSCRLFSAGISVVSLFVRLTVRRVLYIFLVRENISTLLLALSFFSFLIFVAEEMFIYLFILEFL